MDLKTIKQYDDSWWLAFLKDKSIFDTDNIKAQKDWLVEQAENIETALYELDILYKKVNPSENSSIDSQFKRIIDILRNE